MVIFVSHCQSSNQQSTPPITTQRRRDGCSECRRKKVKCDLRRPVCSRCTRFPKECLYGLSIISQTDAQKPTPKRPVAFPEKPILPAELNTSALVQQPVLNLSPLLSSEQSKFFLHILSTETAPSLFPAAPKFFIDRLISSAIETPHLLYALLASASSHHSRLIGDTTAQSHAMCLRFTNLSISGLRTAMNETTDMLRAETALTAMTLCTNDVCNGNMHIWRSHLSGVMQLLKVMLNAPRRSLDSSDPFVLCLVKWFATLDILACVSGVNTGETLQGQNSLLGQLPSSIPSHVDDICGYSLELIPLLARTAQVACQTGMHAASGVWRSDLLSQELVSEAEILETAILAIAERTASQATKDHHGNELPSELRYTHLAFVHSALLYLHRRVWLLPKEHPTVRSDIANILDAVENIPPFSSSNILILWPIFNAGCETDVVSDRNQIQDRMACVQSRGLGNFTRARGLMKEFWASNTSLPWDVYFAQHGRELVLF
ncbi:hypothetical protein P170DRAFT_443577 [Aspergillus steynii IBT 23096]|uniref:Zn(2)-C6 fungal-type domain-containing protein n=1 Tax=Aspergillus steynii IBT 23096 TaxID=1392250 RepID=A0A2I2GSM9_9EURO|nr:uncharacterized protein P170DRAFT_443577 [Aspergillus steynii IBT 23096]PLB55881.1 hypothetical protein P170DRAFT_443577 [Aspergillus steynii IBT 23096]